MMKRIAMITMCTLGLGLGTSTLVSADPAPAKDAPAAAAASGASAEIKVGTGVEKFEITGEAATFPAGTTVWAWSKITNGEGNVKHIWKLDGKEVWSMALPVSSKKWSTGTRRTIPKAGNWEVEVVTESGESLGKVTFSIQ